MIQEYGDYDLHFYEADKYIIGTTFELEQEEYSVKNTSKQDHIRS